MTITKIRTCTWNICTAILPFHNPYRVMFGAMLGQDWTHPKYDVPLFTDSKRAKYRFQLQQEQLQKSDADLIFLQEVLSENILAQIVPPDYIPVFHRSLQSRRSSIMLWLTFVTCVTICQLLIMSPFISPDVLLTIPMAIANHERWKRSIIYEFIMGTISGQIVTLKKQNSYSIRNIVYSRTHLVHPSLDAPWWVRAMCAIRPRVYTYQYAITHQSHKILFLHTHLPQDSDNVSILRELEAQMSLKIDATFLVGDMNTPSVDIPYTRYNKNPTYRTKLHDYEKDQLDYIIVKAKGDVYWSLYPSLTSDHCMVKCDLYLDVNKERLKLIC